MNTNLQYWQRHAHSACFEMNQQLKQVSQRFFYDYTQSPDMNTLLNIISKGSDTLVFTLFSYLSKYPNFFAKNYNNLTYLITCINSWELRGFTFVRSNHPPFQKYVTRTIMASLGIFLKILYQNIATSNELLNFLQNLQSKYFKLYLLKCFVDAVEVVDYDMGYISYRLMVYNFQDNAIPMICDVLMPYFYSIEEGVQMTQLSLLQQNLNVSDDVMTNTQQKITISSEQEVETDFVFILLQKIVEFNYNITYSEYQSDQPIETCLISFPQRVAQKILNHQFLNALFFIIDKVSDAKVRERKHEYLQISLNCVAKMMQSRLAYLKEDVKEQFIYHSIKGLTLLLMKCHQIGSQTLLKGILVCNKRLYMSCQLMYLKKIATKLSANQNQGLYSVYIQNLTNTINLVVQKGSIQIENYLLTEAMEISNKIILSYGFRDEESLERQYLFFSNFIKSIIRDFIHNLCIPHSILQSYTIISIAESKALANQLFQKFKRLASINFSYLFERIQQQLNLFVTSQQRSPIQFANILYILSQLIDHNYLQRNILLNEAKDTEYRQLGIIVQKALGLVKQYVCNRHLFKNSQSIYVNAAIIIFVQSISIDFLMGFEFVEKIQIKQKLFHFMTYEQSIDNQAMVDDNKSEETLLTFVYILVNYIQTQNQKEQDLTLTQYSLDIIERCIMKIKWRLRLETYEKALIIQYLQDFFQKLFYSALTHSDIRTRASKIIALLTLQSIDDYKFRINKYISIMKMQSIKIIQYDIIGIFEGIQSQAIVKYLYRKINKQINIQQLFDSLFLKARHENNEKQYRDLTKLLSVLLYNRYFRSPSSIIAYENFKILLPYLIELLKTINKDNDIDMDLWESSLTILFELFKGFSTGMVNVFLLQTYTNAYSQTNLVQQFVIQIIKSLVLVSQNIKQYPQLQPIVLNVICDINKELLDYIFRDQTRRLTYAHAFLIVKIIDICNDYMKMMLHGNKIQEERLMVCLNSLQFFYTYFNRKRKIVHQSVTISNLQELYQMLENFVKQGPKKSKNEQFIDSLLNFIISNHKNNLTYLRKIAKLLFQLNQSFRQYVTRSMVSLHVNNQKLLEIQEILGFNQQETFVDKMKTWVRQIDVFGM